MEEMKREICVSYSSYNFCKSLSEEFCDYYEGRYRLYFRFYFYRREKERKF